MLEFQGEGGEGHILRHGHDGDSGEVAGGIVGVPLAAGSVEPERVTCCGNSPSEKLRASPLATGQCPPAEIF